MILFTDGGSTKCDWVMLDKRGNLKFKTTTKGLNPAVLAKPELAERIKENETLRNAFEEVKVLDFYGAGCGTAIPKAILKAELENLFSTAEINVYEDMTAAVYAVTTEPGIVCILGTGSNSCYFDGTEVHIPIPSLGYILMDEASGKYLGSRLIRDYFYKNMPVPISSNFEARYNLDPDEIKLNLYQRSNPNAYLASFAEFIFMGDFDKGYFHNLIKDGLYEFINCRILTYKEAKEVPIHFVGSIAHFSKEIIKECLMEKNLEMGNIVQRPIDGLIDFYREKLKSPPGPI